MLMPSVSIIREEKRAATAALMSLRLGAHRAPKPTEPPKESKQNSGAEEEPKRKKQEELSGEEPEEKTREGERNFRPAVFR